MLRGVPLLFTSSIANCPAVNPAAPPAPHLLPSLSPFFPKGHSSVNRARLDESGKPADSPVFGARGARVALTPRMLSSPIIPFILAPATAHPLTLSFNYGYVQFPCHPHPYPPASASFLFFPSSFPSANPLQTALNCPPYLFYLEHLSSFPLNLLYQSPTFLAILTKV